MWNSMVMITVCFRLEIKILGTFSAKIRNFLFKVKFGTQTNSSVWFLMVTLTSSVLD